MASTNLTRKIKIVFLTVFALMVTGWFLGGKLPAATLTASAEPGEMNSVMPLMLGDDYVGSETCQACHEAQFKSFAGTKHARLSNAKDWKGKMHGCESCHGPGKEHVDGGGDKSKITTFSGKDSKAISETCLACHAGKESHNNFRRGEHWRNDVGCTDCHSPHGADHDSFKADSITLIGKTTRQNPSIATTAMLKGSEPQLCIACHSEVKAQFSKPFRHKVLEGAMKCSDCHNPHGGFESKQTKLAAGVDASCVKCHTDKQGPFVFEHAPLKIEGCSACHSPHGSANPKQLKRAQVRQLCLECHSGITEQLSDGPTGGPHGQTSIRSQNCTVCHSKIHGSNASSVFFR